MTEQRRKGRMEAATFGVLSPEQRRSPLGVAALVLASHMDSLLISGRDAATVSKELRVTLLELRKEAPLKQEGKVDDLKRKREARRATAG